MSSSRKYVKQVYLNYFNSLQRMALEVDELLKSDTISAEDRVRLKTIGFELDRLGKDFNETGLEVLEMI